jgi:hypothetical protein
MTAPAAARTQIVRVDNAATFGDPAKPNLNEWRISGGILGERRVQFKLPR